MEAMTLLVSAMVDEDKRADIRIEAAMAKLWGTERAWEIVNETMQIRGGRGYETAASLDARGEKPDPVERLMRDSRINTIFEGASEIMRLFLAREALDPHLKIGAAIFNTTLSRRERMAAALRAAWYYARWYPRQLLPRISTGVSDSAMHPVLRRHLRRTRRLSAKLARGLFHAMLRHGPKLDRQQLLLGKFVDIGCELFAMSAVCARAQADVQSGREDSLDTADFFCRSSRLTVSELFRGVRRNTHKQGYRLAQKVLGS